MPTGNESDIRFVCDPRTRWKWVSEVLKGGLKLLRLLLSLYIFLFITKVQT